jgi:hypothetical protein
MVNFLPRAFFSLEVFSRPDKRTILSGSQSLSTKRTQVPTKQKTWPYSGFEVETFGFQFGIATN